MQNSNIGKPLRVATFEENWLVIDNKDFNFFVRFRKTSRLFLRPDFGEVRLEGWVGIYDLKEKSEAEEIYVYTESHNTERRKIRSISIFFFIIEKIGEIKII